MKMPPYTLIVLLMVVWYTEERKRSGSGGTGGCSLKNGALQLAAIFHFLNDFRPVALTSLTIMTFEKIVKELQLSRLKEHLVPLICL